MTEIAQKIQQNSLELQKELQSIDQVTVHYPGTTSGIITFQVDGMDAGEVKKHLWTPYGNRTRFDVSAVPATSTPLDSARTGVPDLARTSVSYLTTSDDIGMLIDRLKAIL
jgi:selenocysteine lyase/cysteine desulfurase